jgi:hypothetical protein
MKRLNILILLIAGLLPMAARAGVILQFDPADAVLMGVRGQVVGWDLIFTNDTPDYAIWVGTSIEPSVGVFPDSSVGVFTDFSLYNFIIVGPGETSGSQTFAPSPPAGVGSFAISNTAPYGRYQGQMTFVYDLYSADPTVDSGANYLGEFNTQEHFELDVVPEPASLWLCSSVALLALGLRRRRR